MKKSIIKKIPETTIAPEIERLIVCSDLHLHGGRGDTWKTFQSLLESIPDKGHGLVLLGDLFEVWLGPEHLQSDIQKEVVALLSSLVKRNITVLYVEGNRDLFIRHHHRRRTFTDVFDGMANLRWHNRVIHICHGDLVNTEDRKYQHWRTLIQSRPVHWLSQHLPANLCVAAAKTIDHRLRSTNLEYKLATIPKQMIENYLGKFSSQSNLAVFGHFHHSHTYSIGRQSVICLPAWSDFNHTLIIDQRGDFFFLDEFQETVSFESPFGDSSTGRIDTG